MASLPHGGASAHAWHVHLWHTSFVCLQPDCDGGCGVTSQVDLRGGAGTVGGDAAASGSASQPLDGSMSTTHTRGMQHAAWDMHVFAVCRAAEAAGQGSACTRSATVKDHVQGIPAMESAVMQQVVCMVTVCLPCGKQVPALLWLNALGVRMGAYVEQGSVHVL